MAEESKFVDLAHAAAKKVLRFPLYIERGSVLLYQITVDDRLETTVNPKKPKRGDSAFQTEARFAAWRLALPYLLWPQLSRGPLAALPRATWACRPGGDLQLRLAAVILL